MGVLSLSTAKNGIDRLRIKGGASAQNFYDLVNGYITQEGTVVPREGTTREETLDDTTAGLTYFATEFNVFSDGVADVPASYQCNVLVNPNNLADTLLHIWFSKPFMGFLYVVAEFASGDVEHYWLQSSGVWTPSNVYIPGTIVEPTDFNGLAYEATRLDNPNPVWAPSTGYTAISVVEPSTVNGFKYIVVSIFPADGATSGATEPTWPTTVGATVYDYGNYQVNELNLTSEPTSGLSSNITNKYGNTNIYASGAANITGPTMGGVNYNTGPGKGLSPSQPAPVTPTGIVSVWTGGTLYQPGAMVIPTTNQGAVTGAIPNGDFENGDDGSWAKTGNWAIGAVGQPFSGLYEAYSSPASTNGTLTQATPAACVAGTTITAQCMMTAGTTPSAVAVSIRLVWYNSSGAQISYTDGGYAAPAKSSWGALTVTGTAPAGTVSVACQIHIATGTADRDTVAVDNVQWNYVQAATATDLIYVNEGTAAATSGSSEPTWPATIGDTVVDGGVTWTAIGSSVIEWQAVAIMESGSSEPAWPTTVGGTMADGNGTFAWTAISRAIADPNCPKTKSVLIGASKVFAINGDIVNFSATTNPTDWSSANDAGYLPTGMQQYGTNPAAVLSLYRGNLMVFNSEGYQMWQIDPDPANMALLDAEPVGSTEPLCAQPVANDLLFLAAVGVRNIGTVGSTGNLQAGTLGQPIDALIQAELAAGTYTPISVYYPARGQYWLIFGPTAYVMTVNGTSQRSWSRYVFPDAIEYATLASGLLYLRTTTDYVWLVDLNALQDDVQVSPGYAEFTIDSGQYGDSTSDLDFTITAATHGSADPTEDEFSITAGPATSATVDMTAGTGSTEAGGVTIAVTAGQYIDSPDNLSYYGFDSDHSIPYSMGSRSPTTVTDVGTLESAFFTSFNRGEIHSYSFTVCIYNAGGAPAQSSFTSVGVACDAGGSYTLLTTDAEYTTSGDYATWVWTLAATGGYTWTDGDTYNVTFTVPGLTATAIGFSDGSNSYAGVNNTAIGSATGVTITGLGTVGYIMATGNGSSDVDITLVIAGVSAAPAKANLTEIEFTAGSSYTLTTEAASYSTSGIAAMWQWTIGTETIPFTSGDSYDVTVVPGVNPDFTYIGYSDGANGSVIDYDTPMGVLSDGTIGILGNICFFGMANLGLVGGGSTYVTIAIAGASGAPAQGSFDNITFTGHSGTSYELTSATASYVTDFGNRAYWSWDIGTGDLQDLVQDDDYDIDVYLPATGFNGYSDGANTIPGVDTYAIGTITGADLTGFGTVIAALFAYDGTTNQTVFYFAVTGASAPPINMLLQSVKFTGHSSTAYDLTPATATYSYTGNTALWTWVVDASGADLDFLNSSDYTIDIAILNGEPTQVGYESPSYSDYGAISGEAIDTVGTVEAAFFYWDDSVTTFTLIVRGVSGAPTQTGVTQISFNGASGQSYVFATSNATYSVVDHDATWTWTVANYENLDLQLGNSYPVQLTAPNIVPINSGVDFNGILWWPWLDDGTPGEDKMLVGFDLAGTGEVNVSIGYNQNDPTAFTDDYYIADADTYYGMPTAIPVAGKSFSLYLEFLPNQAWQLSAANLYVNPFV